MAGEIASAFVRIRPDSSNFKGETQSGVLGAIKEIAVAAAGIFAAEKIFDFGKEAVSGAATLQKSLEVIDSQFGKASGTVKAFGDDAAAQFGISAQVADATSARFGILFSNLGIGNQKAAEMTIGFEKLTGSLAAVRGVDPSDVLNSIVQAAAGNTRGLKQLGIVIDNTMIKQEALKLGLISSIKDGITPATKAQAIYALATQNLGILQQQAAAHSGDLVDQQKKLSAEWSNAKDQLGAVLLPIVTKVVTVFAENLPRAMDVAKAALEKLVGVIRGISSVVSPVIHELIDGAKQLIQAYQSGGIVGVLDKLKSVFEGLSGPAKLVALAIGGIAASLTASAASGAFSAITQSVTAILTASGPLAAFLLGIVAAAEAFQYLYQNSAQFRDIVAQITAFLTSTVLPIFKELYGVIQDIGAAFGSGGGLSGAIHAIITDFSSLSTGAKIVEIAIGAITIGLVGMWAAAAGPLVLIVAAILAIGAAFAYAYEHSARFRDIVGQVKQFLISDVLPVFKSLANEARTDLDGLVETFRSRWDQIKTIFNTVVTIIKGIWHIFGDDIKKTIATDFAAVRDIVDNSLKILEGVIALFIDVLTGKWGKAWGDIKQIAVGLVGNMVAVLKILLGDFLTWIEKAALKIALAIAEPFSHLPGNLGQWARDLKDSINGKLAEIAGSVSGPAGTIGIQIGDGVAAGINASTPAVGAAMQHMMGAAGVTVTRSMSDVKVKVAAPATAVGSTIATNINTAVGAGLGGGGGGGGSKISDAVQKALDAAKAKVEQARSTVTTAFQNLGSMGIKAFEAGTSAELTKFQGEFNAEIKNKVTDPMNAVLARLAAQNKTALAALDAQQAAPTDAEKQLSDLQDAHDEAARLKAIADAQQQKNTDVASGTADAATLVADQQAIDDALYAEQVATLQKKAAAERAALDKSTAAKRDAINQQYADDQANVQAAYASLQAALQKTYDTKVLNYQSERDLQETQLQTILDNLSKSLALHPGEWQKVHDEIMKMFSTSFGPDYDTAGKNMGIGFAKGIEKSFTNVKKVVAKLAGLIADYIPKSPAKVGPLSKSPNWTGYLTDGLKPGLVSGAIAAALLGVGGGGGRVSGAPDLLGALSPLGAMVDQNNQILEELRTQTRLAAASGAASGPPTGAATTYVSPNAIAAGASR